MRTVIPHKAHLVPKGARCVFKGIIYDVYHWQQPAFDGSLRTFEMLKRADTVKVLAVHGDKIVAISDEQPGRPPKLTLPGGRHDDPAETELDCAKREMLEETGMCFKNWRLIQAYQPHNKIEHMVYIFLATDLMSQVTPTPDFGGEKIEINEMSFAQAKKIANDRPDDHYWPVSILQKAGSLQDILALPEPKTD